MYRKVHKDEISESGKLYYQKNKASINKRIKQWRESHKDEIAEQQRVRYQEADELLKSLKTSCVKCGESRYYVLQFHHINPTDKSFEINVAKVSHTKRDILELEVKKCAILCANCHTEFHHLYGRRPKTPVESFNEYLGGSD